MQRRAHASWPIRLALLLAMAVGCLVSLGLARRAEAAPPAFTPGNIVVYRVGDGASGLLNTGAVVYLDEYTPAGTLVQSLALPTATSGANRRLIANGTSTSEGFLTLSADGRYLVLSGYDAALATSGLTGTTGSTVPRVVARVDASGAIDTSTALTDFASGGNPRTVASTDGNDIWVAGSAGGARYTTLGATTTTQVSTTTANLRQLVISGGQLFTSSSSGSTRVAMVGTGLPETAGSTITNLPGFATTGSPYGYFFADLSGAVAGVDTLYVADDGAGLQKWSLAGGSWSLVNTLGSSSDAYRGLTGSVSGSTVTLFATRKGGSSSTGGGELVSIVDATGYGASMTATPALLASSGTNKAFRGVAFAPQGEVEPPTGEPVITTDPESQSIASGTTATLTVTAIGDPVLSYQWYAGETGDTSNPVGTDSSSFTTPSLTSTASYWVRVTNGAGSDDSATAVLTIAGAVCTAPVTTIGVIQGAGAATSFSDSRTVRGVVVQDMEGASPGFQGFFVQNISGESDGNPATSDGIFVFNSGLNQVSAGDVVQVTGTAGEFSGMTQLTSPTIELCGTTATIDPVDVSFPLTLATDLEKYEGMLVRLPQELVIAEYFNYDRFGEVVLALPLPGEDRPFTGTAVDDPGAAANARAAANALSRITLDDVRNDQNPSVMRHPDGMPFTLTHSFRGGDTLTNVVGVLDYRFSLYRIQPTTTATYEAVNPRPAGPPALGGSLTVTGMNALNYFVTLTTSGNVCGPLQNMECRGANDATEFGRQRAKLLAAILAVDPAIAGLMEIENTPGAEPLADIVAGLNAATAPGKYAYIATGTIGGDAIKVGIIYQPAKVTPLGAYEILDRSVDSRFIDMRSRPVLAQSFEENSTGAVFTIAVNHLKSKGSACTSVVSATGEFSDPDLGDGQGNCNVTRTLAAQALVDWLATDPTRSGDEDYLIIGDLNSYAKEDPIDAILAGPDDIAGTSDDYVNLILRDQGTYAYSYVFDGQFGYLDHAIASASLASQVLGAGEWHNNSDEPDVLDYDMSFKSPLQDALYEPLAYRTSDHDGVILGLNLTFEVPASVTITGGPDGTTNDTTPAFTFTTENASGTECRIDAGSFASCGSPFTASQLSEGGHTFEVRTTGTGIAASDIRSFVIDTTPPQTTFDSTPSNPSGPNVTFTFSADETSTFACSLENAQFTACSSGIAVTGLATGSHSFRVQATDAAGNTDSTPASYTWIVDATPPNTTITSGPSGTRSTGDGVFAFNAAPQGGTFECRLDNGAWEACAIAYPFSGLLNGVHTFEVRAIDTFGNIDPTPATRTWAVNDVTGPRTQITAAPPKYSSATDALFNFSARDNTTPLTFQCRLDPVASSPWLPCPAPSGPPAPTGTGQAFHTGLADGMHKFEVRAVDPAGNPDSRPATFSWTVDTTKPQLVATLIQTGNPFVPYTPGTWSQRPVRVNVTCSDPGVSPAGIASNSVTQNRVYSNGIFDTGLIGAGPDRCTDRAGNVADPVGPFIIQSDTRMPTCSASPAMQIIPASGGMVTVTFTLAVTDNLTADYALEYAITQSVIGDGNTVPADIGATTIDDGTASIEVRATRGNRPNRIYTIRYLVTDEAGNSAVCQSRIRVQ